MLNDYQTSRTWDSLLAAETLSLYFGDLSSRYTRRRQWITGVSFFFSSGAAATAIAKAPTWVPIVLALVVAVATAYAIAVNLDRQIATMTKLHSLWSRIATDYEYLWNHAHEEDAEERLYTIIEREKEPSELATTDAPNDQVLIGKWQDRVFKLHRLNQTA